MRSGGNGGLRRVRNLRAVVRGAGAAVRRAAELFHPAAEGDVKRDTPAPPRKAAGRGGRREADVPRYPRGIQPAAQDACERAQLAVGRFGQGKRRPRSGKLRI